jgi:hypothetical protein
MSSVDRCDEILRLIDDVLSGTNLPTVTVGQSPEER